MQRSLTERLVRSRLQWAGHVERMADDRLPKRAEELREQGRRRRGRPRLRWEDCVNLFPLIPACTARPGLPLSPPETAFLESPYYRPQTALIADRHRPTNFHSVTYTQTDDAAFEAGSDNDHKSFLRMRVIFKVEYPAELFRFRRVLDDILSSFDVF